jgi:hypothetical protein
MEWHDFRKTLPIACCMLIITRPVSYAHMCVPPSLDRVNTNAYFFKTRSLALWIVRHSSLRGYVSRKGPRAQVLTTFNWCLFNSDSNFSSKLLWRWTPYVATVWPAAIHRSSWQTRRQPRNRETKLQAGCGSLRRISKNKTGKETQLKLCKVVEPSALLYNEVICDN